MRFPQIRYLAAFQSSTAWGPGCWSPSSRSQLSPIPLTGLGPHKETWRLEEPVWGLLPSRDTPSGSLPRLSKNPVAQCLPLRNRARRALLHPNTALVSPPGVRFPWPSSLGVWALVQCCCCLRNSLARTDVRTCLLILVWLINHYQPPPPTGIQVLQAPSVSDSYIAEGKLSNDRRNRGRTVGGQKIPGQGSQIYGLGVGRHQGEGHRPLSEKYSFPNWGGLGS